MAFIAIALYQLTQERIAVKDQRPKNQNVEALGHYMILMERKCQQQAVSQEGNQNKTHELLKKKSFKKNEIVNCIKYCCESQKGEDWKGITDFSAFFLGKTPVSIFYQFTWFILEDIVQSTLYSFTTSALCKEKVLELAQEYLTSFTS